MEELCTEMKGFSPATLEVWKWLAPNQCNDEAQDMCEAEYLLLDLSLDETLMKLMVVTPNGIGMGVVCSGTWNNRVQKRFVESHGWGFFLGSGSILN